MRDRSLEFLSSSRYRYRASTLSGFVAIMLALLGASNLIGGLGSVVMLSSINRSGDVISTQSAMVGVLVFALSGGIVAVHKGLKP